jgi:hypothetical protein
MLLSNFCFGFVCLVVLCTPLAAAPQVDLEASVSGGSISNLYSDSGSHRDTYTTTSVSLDYMPLSFAKANLLGEYTYYGEAFRLSNLIYGGGLTLIPLSDSSAFSVYLEGNFRERRYRESGDDSGGINANEFTGGEYHATAALGYSFNDRIQVRSGLSFQSYGYNIDGVIDRNNLDLFAGINTSLLSRLALDLEAGYGGGRFQHVNPTKPVFGQNLPRGTITPDSAYAILLGDNIRSWYLSARISTSVGRKTGLGLTFSFRKFTEGADNVMIYGYSSGYLSPWVGTYEGSACVGSLKTFLIPRLVTTVKLGYWHRDYLPMIDIAIREKFGQQILEVNTNNAADRRDYRWRGSVSLQMPLRHSQEGYSIEPTVQIGYTSNNSTSPVYDYSDLRVSGGFTVRF